MMDTKDIAAGMIAEIREHGWGKGTGVGPGGEICLAVAMNNVVSPLISRREMTNEEYYAKAQEVLAVIEELFPGRSLPPYCGSNISGEIPWFNDHRDTTEEDVLLVLKHLAGS